MKEDLWKYLQIFFMEAAEYYNNHKTVLQYCRRKKMIMKKNLLSLIFAAGMLCSFMPVHASDESVAVFRLYNRNTGEHLYTSSEPEKDHLVSVGWSDEGIGWYGAVSGDPVYRVYNPNAKGGDHYYTVSKAEADGLVALGWQMDNNGQAAFYSAGNVDLYQK